MIRLDTKETENPPCTLDKEFNPLVQSVSFLLMENFLSTAECEWLVNYGSQQKLAKGLNRNQTETHYRSSNIAFLELVSEVDWLKDKIINKILPVNNKYMKWNLTHLDRFQYTTYDKDDYLTAHNDDYFDYLVSPDSPEQDLWIRKLSVSILLSDPSEYDGGELEIQAPRGTSEMPYDKRKIKPPKGTAIIFPSFYIHEVHKVTKGHRRALVAWFFGPKWR